MTINHHTDRTPLDMVRTIPHAGLATRGGRRASGCNRRPLSHSRIAARSCTTKRSRERPPRMPPVLARRLAQKHALEPASAQPAQPARPRRSCVNEKPPVSTCAGGGDIGGRQSGRPGSNRRHSAWEPTPRRVRKCYLPIVYRVLWLCKPSYYHSCFLGFSHSRLADFSSDVVATLW